jgi:hypothetical protein
MQIAGLGANPLVSLGARPSASVARSFALQNTPANFSAGNAKSLPPVQPVALSMDMLLTLQGEQETEDTIAEVQPPSAEELFFKEARKSPMERMREQVMKDLGLTEEALAAMPPEEKRAAEDKIRDMIEEKLKQGMRSDAPAETAGDMVLEAALG